MSVTDCDGHSYIIHMYTTLGNLGIKISDAIVQYDIAYIKCLVSCPKISLVYYFYSVIDLLITASYAAPFGPPHT